MDLARQSARVQEVNEAVLAMADQLTDPTIRSKTLDVLRNPAATYGYLLTGGPAGVKSVIDSSVDLSPLSA
jgi:hypothetical protein